VRRSNLLVLAGIAFFVVGVVIVALLQRDSGSSTSSGNGSVDVLFAKEDLAAGTNGEDVIDKVEVRRINANDKQPDALTTPSQLSNTILTAKFSKGEQIRAGGLRARSAVPQVPVPDGKEAVAVSVQFVPGGAGYVAPGDVVNVYQVIPGPVRDATGGGAQLPYGTPRAQLLLTKVKVLDVQQQVAALNGVTTSTTTPSNQTGVVSRPNATGNQMTVLLAVDSIDAEKLVFGSTGDENYLYLTRVDDKAAASGPTPGRDFQNIFDESPEVANARDH